MNNLYLLSGNSSPFCLRWLRSPFLVVTCQFLTSVPVGQSRPITLPSPPEEFYLKSFPGNKLLTSQCKLTVSWNGETWRSKRERVCRMDLTNHLHYHFPRRQYSTICVTFGKQSWFWLFRLSVFLRTRDYRSESELCRESVGKDVKSNVLPLFWLNVSGDVKPKHKDLRKDYWRHHSITKFIQLIYQTKLILIILCIEWINVMM